ncbi:MAG: hypothetical protein M3O31_16685 [Acidobacteriota bacterium]|nr:hypothetical protein [Acidobacteriota bacterium]
MPVPFSCAHSLRHLWTVSGLSALICVLAGCASSTAPPAQTPPPNTTPTASATYHLTGDVTLVHDPSIIRQGAL